MKKFTEILLNKKYTEKMVEDFNQNNEDMSKLNLDELNIVKTNILTLIASLDDLKRTIQEEIKKKEIDKDKEAVDTYLNFFTKDTSDKNKSDLGLTLEEVRKEEPKKENKHKVAVPEKVKKAIEIAKKYNVGVPYIASGDIVNLIENGLVSVDEAMADIINLYHYLLETQAVSNEDAEYIIRTLADEIKLEDLLKSVLGSALKAAN